MATKYTFLKLCEDVLSSSDIPLTYKEVWNKALEMGLDKKLDSSGQTPWRSISTQLSTNIKKEGNSSLFEILNEGSGETTRYGIRGKKYSKECAVKALTNRPKGELKEEHKERDLHPLLSYYVDYKFSCHVKTIDDKKSIKGKYGDNLWIHPDMVGVYYAFDDYMEETQEFMKCLCKNPSKIFSFEIKKELNSSNLKKNYFQAVSNSSWAHEGYIVAFDIDAENKSLFKEISRLNNQFGIGVIHLKAHPDQSEILFPAKENKELDWDTVDRIAEINPDFHSFIVNVVKDIEGKKTPDIFDAVLEEEEMMEYVRKKKIPME